MSRSPHHQRPDLAAKALKRLESELAARGTPLRERSDRPVTHEPVEAPRIRRVVIDD